MVVVSQRLGFKVNLGDFNNVDVSIEIAGIDADEDIDAQIEQAKTAIKKAWPEILAGLGAEIKQVRAKAPDLLKG